MALHLQRQINALKKIILSLGATVEESVQDAISAIERRDIEMAKAVVRRDQTIDEMSIELEEECLHTLALHQPVAFDLRFIAAAMKIGGELERIGDLAVNIAEQAVYLIEGIRAEPVPFDLPGMTQLVRDMVQKSLDALVNFDKDLAIRVCEMDDAVDQIHRTMYSKVENAIRGDPELVQTYIHLLSVSRNLERMADHAVSVAEDVLYMTEGEIHRHNRPHPMVETTEASKPGE